MRILSVGSLSGMSNTCLHRNWALHKIAEEVEEVNTEVHPWSMECRIRYHLFCWGFPVRITENDGENAKICQLVSKYSYDLVWIDKGQTIAPETLTYIKQISPKTILVSYSPDNMVLRHNQTQQYLECVPLYDYIVTNKSYTMESLKRMGAKEVIFVNNSYEESFHHPRTLSAEDHKDYGGDVGFVGVWEEDRCRSICYLADHGIKVRVFGDAKWKKYNDYSPNLTIEGRLLMGEDYCKALQAFRISLCFLRKMNYDQQTTRSVEIPACGGFMLAERTQEHLSLFTEDEEASFFSSDEELLSKCEYFLAHDKEREEIAERGNRRCTFSGYGNEQMIRKVLDFIYGK